MDPAMIIRAGEIALAAAGPLIRLIADALEHDADEAAALRTALATLSARPDLRAVLPTVRTLVAGHRARMLAERVGVAKTDPPPPSGEDDGG